MTRVGHWKRGDPTLWKVVDEWLAGDPPLAEFISNDRRRVARLRTDQGVDIVVKRFLPARGTQRWIAAGRRCLAQSSALREWRALARLRSVGSNVPEPLALARLLDGGELLVTSFVEGESLLQALKRSASDRRRLLTRVGDQVALMHSSGFVHRDLHLGNWIVDADGQPVLLDFQRAWKTRRGGARMRDIGSLDFSLAHAAFSIADRVRFRAAALGIAGGTRASRQTRGTLRARRDERGAHRRVAKASAQRANRHYSGCTRRCLRTGPLYARIDIEGRSGLRLREIPSEVIEQALTIHQAVQAGEGASCMEGKILKRDHRSRVTSARVEGRSLVIKEVVKRGRRRLLADSLRGSPARRAWVGGHGLLARGILAATPLAFVETRRLGVPLASTLILEDIRPARPADELDDATRLDHDLAEALRRLAVSLHRRGVIHGDFQAPHIYLCERAGRLESALIDLEGVRFQRRLSDTQRIQSLAELNASLPDDLMSPAERRRAFERYAQVLPFGDGEAAQSERLAAEAEIVRRSLAREHLWKGEGCRAASHVAGDGQIS